MLFQNNSFAKINREGILIVTDGYLIKPYRDNRNFEQITSGGKRPSKGLIFSTPVRLMFLNLLNLYLFSRKGLCFLQGLINQSNCLASSLQKICKNLIQIQLNYATLMLHIFFCCWLICPLCKHPPPTWCLQ